MMQQSDQFAATDHERSSSWIAPELLIDSGAFSAWNSGKVIDVRDYARFLDGVHDHMMRGINLDVIPARLKDKRRTPQQLTTDTLEAKEEAAKLSWGNFDYLRRAGLDPLPVFHYGERWYWFEKMLDSGADYIALGGLARLRAPDINEWVTKVFDRICDADGYPTIRLHGLGVTSCPLVARYPWYSVDSISWTLRAGFGFVLMPRVLKDTYDYTHEKMVPVTDDPRALKLRGRRHALASPFIARQVDAYLMDLGTTLEMCAEHVNERAYANACYFINLGESLPWPRRHANNGVCAPTSFAPTTTRVHLAGAQAWQPLLDAGAHARLLSYWDLRSKPASWLARYVIEGRGDKEGSDGPNATHASSRPRRRESARERGAVADQARVPDGDAGAHAARPR